MDDHAALLAATAAAPADDLARLVYADFREDRGDADYARFVRRQVHLDALPAWHPDVVRAKYRTPDDLSGAAFAAELPRPPGFAWEWPAAGAFRRGLPYALFVRDLTGFLDHADALFDRHPVGELRLPTSTLDEWRRFAGRPWLPRIESIRFYGLSTPIEPIRVLCEAPNATGLVSLAFEKAGGPAVPVLLADLFDSPLGRRLKRLELHAGADHQLEWLAALARVGPEHALEDLVLVTMGVTGEVAEDLVRLPLARNLTRLTLRNNPVVERGARALADAAALAGLTSLTVVNGRLPGWEAAGLVRSAPLAGLADLDLGGNPLGQFAWPRDAARTGLRAFRVRDGACPPMAVGTLTRSAAWPGLAELDLRGCRNLPRTWDHLTAAPPTDLAALVLSAAAVPAPAADRLRARYGDAVVFAD